MLESNQHLAIIDRGLDLRANPAWCAVRELSPHLLGVGQLFWSVELPARKIGGGYRSRTCLAALIWRRSSYKPCPSPEAPPWWLAMDSNHPRRLYESRTSAGTDAEASPRFPSPLIKPDVPVSSIRLSDGLHRKAHAMRGGGPSRRTLSSPKIR